MKREKNAMKILIPTAKDMSKTLSPKHFEPVKEKTRKIIERLSQMSTGELARLYKIKEEQAKKEKERFDQIKEGTAAMYPAILLFDGLMYRSISRGGLSSEEEDYLQKNVLICSSLYGMIPPYTLISEHRLDFLQNIKIEGRSLKQYWREEFEKEIAGEKEVLSLLSEEFESVFSKEKTRHWISPLFKERTQSGLRVHSTVSKKARGELLSYLMRNRVENIEEIRKIEFAGFRYEGEEKGRALFIK